MTDNSDAPIRQLHFQLTPKPVIIPLRAFHDASDMAGFAAMVRGFSRDGDDDERQIDPDEPSAAQDFGR